MKRNKNPTVKEVLRLATELEPGEGLLLSAEDILKWKSEITTSVGDYVSTRLSGKVSCRKIIDEIIIIKL